MEWKEAIVYIGFGIFCLLALLWTLENVGYLMCVDYYSKNPTPLNETPTMLCKSFKIRRLLGDKITPIIVPRSDKDEP